MNLAEHIAAARARLDLTLHHVAVRMGYSTSFIADVEAGRRIVAPKTALRFAQALEADPSEWVRMALQEKLDAQGVPMVVTVTRRVP